MSGILALGINSSAYVSEIFRAGFLSIKKGQIEAAQALGLNSVKTMRLVVLPQAFRVVIPPLVGNHVASAKDTALASAISITELLKAGLSQKALLANPSPLIFVAVVYLMLFIPLTQFAGFLERKLKKSQRQLRLKLARIRLAEWFWPRQHLEEGEGYIGIKHEDITCFIYRSLDRQAVVLLAIGFNLVPRIAVRRQAAWLEASSRLFVLTWAATVAGLLGCAWLATSGGQLPLWAFVALLITAFGIAVHRTHAGPRTGVFVATTFALAWTCRHWVMTVATADTYADHLTLPGLLAVAVALVAGWRSLQWREAEDVEWWRTDHAATLVAAGVAYLTALDGFVIGAGRTAAALFALAGLDVVLVLWVAVQTGWARLVPGAAVALVLTGTTKSTPSSFLICHKLKPSRKPRSSSSTRMTPAPRFLRPC